ncbi:MAG: dihydropteroate synthase, partial [Clostridia bacterium]|nr:dihydropteroate synthase [Clostridia bacterium]
CGTTPAHIAALREVAEVTPIPSLTKKDFTAVSSYTHAVRFGERSLIIGERINPTGKKLLKQALREGDIGYILREGLAQQEHGAHILDVNVGLPELDERAVLTRAMEELQGVLDLPLQLDTSDPAAMAAAMRRYNGKPLVNSVNGKAESMAAIFPLIQQYGGVAVALTLDESGIPDTAEGRVAIAKRIIDTAATYGIPARELLFDPLALTVSAEPNAALVTLETVRRLHEMGLHVSLGVSNVSFGLPNRELLNTTFYAMALQNGLSAAILNPLSAEMMKTYRAFCALNALDENCADYIAFAAGMAPTEPQKTTAGTLQQAIEKGLHQEAGRLAAEMLDTTPPLELIDSHIIPALDEVGRGFEQKTVFLPQLLMSAEAAKAAFDAVKARIPAGETAGDPIVLATVQGDIHDIGKNIVKVLLENYGYRVIDLGRDVPPEKVVAAAKEHGVKLVGLSALMTTTVPAMQETVRQLHEQCPDCRVVVGGAVLTKEYADQIGADAYGKDAMEAVRYAARVFGKE